MSVQQELLDVSGIFDFSDLSTFTQNIPVGWGCFIRVDV